MTSVQGGDVSPVRVRAVTGADGVAGLAGQWRALWQACRGRRTPFLSYEWADVWLRHFGSRVTPHVIVVEQDERVIGIVPLALAPYRIGGLGFDVLESLGGQSRNIIALVAPEKTQVVADAVAGHLGDRARRSRLRLRLDLVPSEEPFLAALTDSLRRCPAGVRLTCRTASTAPYVPLPAYWEDYEQSLGRRRRKVLHRAQRDVDRTFAGQEFRRLGGEQLDAGMKELFRLHQARWAGEGIRGLFTHEASRSFHLDIAREFERLGWLDLSAYLLDGRMVSVHLAAVLDGVVYLLRSGRDPALAGYSVGHLHELRMLRSWIEAGLYEADLLRGAEPYKFYWTRNYRTYVELYAVSNRSMLRASVRLDRFWRRTVRFLQARHSVREVWSYIVLRRRETQERRRMGIKTRI